MARIRTIKPEFFTSPDTAKASVDARLLYIALWCWADDYGIGETNFNAILGFAFPEDDQRTRKEIQSLCKEVANAFGTVFYTVRGRHFYAIPSWDDHQKTQRRATRRNPAPNDPDATPDLRIHPEQGTSEFTQGDSERTQGNPPAGTEEHRNIGTGEVLAHLGTETTDAPAMIEPAGETPPGPKVPIQGWKLVREHTPANLGQSSRSMLAIRVDEMIRSGTPEPDVRACLDLWMTKPEAGPGLLPHLLAEVVKTRDHKPPVEGAATRGANEWIGIANKYGSADTTTELMKELER